MHRIYKKKLYDQGFKDMSSKQCDLQNLLFKFREKIKNYPTL